MWLTRGPISWSARQTRSGDSGRSRMTTPVASRTAAATAGATGKQRALAHALGPVRPGPIAVLDDVALHLQRQVHARRDPVVDGAEVPDAGRRRRAVALHQRVAEAHDRRALVLAADLHRVERACPTSDTVTCRVTSRRRSRGRPRPRPRSQLNSKKAAVPPSGCSGSPSLRCSPMPTTSPPRRPSPRISTSRIGSVPVADADLALLDDDIGLVDRLERAAIARTWAWMSRHSVLDGVAHDHGRATGRGLLVVRHDRGVAHDDVTASTGAPSSSATIWAKIVRAPWPMSDVPA